MNKSLDAASPAQPVRTLRAQGIALLNSRLFALLLPTVLMILYFQQASDGFFLTPNNAALLLRQTAAIAIAAGGVAILIIMGEIDLSIGSVAFICGLVAAKCQMAGWDVVSSLALAVALGAVIGWIHGVLITRLSVAAFVVTLAGLLLWRGLGLLWTDAAAVGPVTSDYTGLTESPLPAAFGLAVLVGVAAVSLWASVARYRRARANHVRPALAGLQALLLPTVLIAGLLWMTLGTRGLPSAFLWTAGIVAILDVMMTRTRFGRRAYLVGSNHEAAKYAGIDVKRTVLLGFVLMGAISGIAGAMLLARVGTSTADAGINLELTAIAAAVIGGVSLRGGIGTVGGALAGAFLLSTIDNGMALLGVSNYAQNVVKALILVLAVGLDGFFTRRAS